MKIKVRVVEKPEKKIKIETEYIRLDSFLKMCDAVQSGGHAKMVIQDGEVKVNGEVCIMRGKKLRPNDKVEFENKIFIVE
ncbi:MAG: S4 domain-containing protein YaaA [Clostridia bacterium]|nr:S4 domain-containing protein YaaA [Clostridia bacterium]